MLLDLLRRNQYCWLVPSLWHPSPPGASRLGWMALFVRHRRRYHSDHWHHILALFAPFTDSNQKTGSQRAPSQQEWMVHREGRSHHGDTHPKRRPWQSNHAQSTSRYARTPLEESQGLRHVACVSGWTDMDDSIHARDDLPQSDFTFFGL